PGPRAKADIQRADPRGGAMQDAIAIPPVLDRAKLDGGFGRQRSDRRAIATREGAGANDDHWPLGLAQGVSKGMPGDGAKRLGSGAEIIVGVGQFGFWTEDANREVSGAPALADARIEDRGFLARVGADDQERIGTVDAGNSRIE